MNAHGTLVNSVVSLISKTKDVLLSLPYKGGLIDRLAETLTHLHKGVEAWHWPTLNDVALKALEGALVETLRVAKKWQNRKVQLLLRGSIFAEELCSATDKIRGSLCKLHLDMGSHQESLKGIKKALKAIIAGFHDKGLNSEFVKAQETTKTELSRVLQSMHFETNASGGSTRLLSWLAKHLDGDIDTIKQELQEMKRNDDIAQHSTREVELELLEQFVVGFTDFEDRAMCTACASRALITAQVNHELMCRICQNLMIDPVIIDSGQSYCKHCIEGRFQEGAMTCPITKESVSNQFFSNFALENVISCFAGKGKPPAVSVDEGKFKPAAETSVNDDEIKLAAETSVDGEYQSSSATSVDEGEFIDKALDIILDGPLEDSVGSLVKDLDSSTEATRLKGLDGLLYVCTKNLLGRLEVFRAGAITALIKLVQNNNPACSKRAVGLLEALTSANGVDQEKSFDRENVHILLEVSNALDVLIPLMREEKLSKLRLLAAETVANILVDKNIRLTVLHKNGIIPAFFAFSAVDGEGQNEDSLRRADRVCVKGLALLANTSDKGEKTQIIMAALLKLVTKGHKSSPELVDLVKDSLTALEALVLSRVTAANDLQIGKAMAVLVPALQWHSTAPGRMSVIRIITRMCDLYKDKAQQLITEKLILNLLRVMKVMTSQPEVLRPSATLLKLCASQAGDMTASVLTSHEEERKVLEDILATRGTSGELDECRLEIFLILDELGIESTQSTVAHGIPILVTMAKSPAAACREKIAYRLRKFVEARQYFQEFELAGGIRALVALLEDRNRVCQQHALIALEALSQNISVPADEIPPSKILGFLGPECDPEVQDAAVGLLGLILNSSADKAFEFVATQGALEATLDILRQNSSSPVRQEAALALLKIGVEDQRVRMQIAKSGLNVLVSYAKDHGGYDFKELLTKMLALSCERAEKSEEDVMKAGGHIALLRSLRENVIKETAAKGLGNLIKKQETRRGVLDAGYITTAVECINQSFASAELSYGLAELCSIDVGLDEIFASSDSVKALLTLFEHCPDPRGKNSAAAVIAKLFPRLCADDKDEDRQNSILFECKLLIKEVEEGRCSTEILEALLAIAHVPKGKSDIFEFKGLTALLHLFPIDNSNVQDLVLKILVELSGDKLKDVKDPRNHMIRVAMVESDITSKVFEVVDSRRPCTQESLKSVLILLRNLSLAGPQICGQLCQQGGVIPVLLKLLKEQPNSSSLTDEVEEGRCSTEILEALLAIAHVPKGKSDIFEFKGLTALLHLFPIDNSNVQDLVLKILVELSGDKLKDVKDPRNHMIRVAMVESDITSKVFEVVDSRRPCTQESLKSVLILLRNLSLAGPQICGQLCQQGGVIPVLLKLLKEQPNSSSLTDEVEEGRCSTEILEALLAIAHVPKGKSDIFEFKGLTALLHLFPIDNSNVQDLVLKILVELSGDKLKDVKDPRNHMIRVAMVESDITSKVFEVVDSRRPCTQESLKSVLILLRNLSLAGPQICGQLCQQGGVIPVLLKLLKEQPNSSSLTDVTELAVIALERFADDSYGRQTLVKEQGVKYLVKVLKMESCQRTFEVKSVATLILIELAKDPQTQKAALKSIYDDDPFHALNQILFYADSGRMKWQTALLLLYLAKYGPAKVCATMDRAGILDGLLALRNVQYCEKIANDVLKKVSDKDRNCRKHIVEKKANTVDNVRRCTSDLGQLHSSSKRE